MKRSPSRPRWWQAVFMAAGVYTVGYALIYQFWLRGRFDQAVPGRCEIEG